MAALDVLRALQNGLEAGCSRGLERFGPEELARHLSIGKVPPILTMCMDQHQVQWCGYHYLVNALGLCCVALMDPNHRHSNDIWNAMRAAGRVSDVLRSMMCHNIVYGPWQSSMWMREFQSASLETVEFVTVDDPLLLRLWGSICLERGYRSVEERSREGRRKYLSELTQSRVFEAKGPKSCISRWFSWNHASAFHLRDHHTRLLVGAFMGLQRGWFQHWTDCWRVPESGLVESTVPAPAPGAASSSTAVLPNPPADGIAVGASPSNPPKTSKKEFINSFHCASWPTMT